MNDYEPAGGVGADLSMEGFDEEPARWPSVLGWFSVVLGALGILKNGFSAVSNLAFGGKGMTGFGQRPEVKEALEKTMAGMSGFIIATGLLAVIALLVSVWLLVAGVKLIKRRPEAAGLHKGWAAVRILIVILEGAAVWVYSTTTTRAVLETMPKGPNAPPPELMAKIMAFSTGCGMCFHFLIFLAYPVTVLIVLSRPWAKSEAERWRSGSGAARPPAA
jgi:hypothetical protein